MGLKNWSSIGSTIYGNPKLSSQARMINEKVTRLLELVSPSKEFYIGKKSGDSVGMRVVGRIPGTADSPIVEGDTVPFGDPPEYHITGQVYRYAHAIAWTGEREDLDRLDNQSTYVKALREHNSRTINKLIYDELVSGRSYTYVPTAAATGEFRTDGSFNSEVADSPLSFWHAQNIVKNLIKNNVPFFDGENYLAALSTTAKFNVAMDTQSGGWIDVKKYAASGAEGVLQNEVGTVGQIRCILDNDVVDDGVGTSSLYGSGFVVGDEGIHEMQVYPMEFRYNDNLGGDFGNLAGVAWQMLLGYKSIWNHTAHGVGGVCHIGSDGL